MYGEGGGRGRGGEGGEREEPCTKIVVSGEWRLSGEAECMGREGGGGEGGEREEPCTKIVVSGEWRLSGEAECMGREREGGGGGGERGRSLALRLWSQEKGGYQVRLSVWGGRGRGEGEGGGEGGEREEPCTKIVVSGEWRLSGEAECPGPELKIAAGHWPFSVQFSTMATSLVPRPRITVMRGLGTRLQWPLKTLTMIVSNCTDGQSKFQLGQPNPKPYF